MQIDWAIHYIQSLIKKIKFGKSHNVNKVKTIGSACNGILMKSCYKRIEGICDIWSSILLYSYDSMQWRFECS